MVELWHITAASNLILVLVYGWIFLDMLKAIIRGNQWRTNPVLVATAGIFSTCAVGHAIHLEHSFEVFRFADPQGAADIGAAGRAMFGDWRLVVMDVITAAVGVWYFTMRRRFAIIYQGAALCADMQERQESARDMHDKVVQGLAHAKLALDMQDREEGHAAVEHTLDQAKSIISGLLGDGRSPRLARQDDLRRQEAGG